MKSEYAVVLYFDSRTNAIFQALIEELAAVTGNFYMSEHCIPPHVTIGDFFAEDAENIGVFAEGVKSGEIEFNGWGAFVPSVLYAIPVSGDYLRACNRSVSGWIRDSGYKENKLYACGNWIPHLTVATKLTAEQFEKARVAAKFTPFFGRAEKIALVKCNPYREICCCDLRSL